jgi:hypothetical protein
MSFMSFCSSGPQNQDKREWHSSLEIKETSFSSSGPQNQDKHEWHFPLRLRTLVFISHPILLCTHDNRVVELIVKSRQVCVNVG